MMTSIQNIFSLVLTYVRLSYEYTLITACYPKHHALLTAITHHALLTAITHHALLTAIAHQSVLYAVTLRGFSCVQHYTEFYWVLS